MKIIITCLTLLLTSQFVYSAQIIVPTDYSQIQTAVDSAATGDTVVILDGTYYQRAVINNKVITLGSEYILDGDSSHIANTVIDADTSVTPAGDSASAFIVTNISSGQVMIAGLTIQNGAGSRYSVFGLPYVVGGGILCGSAISAIRNCVIIDNSCQNLGGGIFSYLSNVQIINCVFETNESFSNGGGLALISSGNSVIDSCTFLGNVGKNGGGAYIPYGHTTVQNCLFEQNYGLLGGGVYIEDNSTNISHCNFFDNFAYKGGGIYGYLGADGEFSNCNFIGNNANLVPAVPGLGGAICIIESQPLIRNCTLYKNSADSGGGVYANSNAVASIENCIITSSIKGGAYSCRPDSRPTVSCTNIYNNVGGDYTGCIAGWQILVENTSLDPQYCLTTDYDLTLNSTSPCLAANNFCSTLIGANDMGCVATGVDDDIPELPNNFQLMQNYPNPFNPSTIITFSIPQKSFVTITVSNILGQIVATLVNESKSAGNYQVTWDGHDQNGNSVSSGIYFYSIETGEFKDSRKMLLLR